MIEERIKILENALQQETDNLQQLEKVKSDIANKIISIRGGIAELKLLDKVMKEQDEKPDEDGADDEDIRDECE